VESRPGRNERARICGLAGMIETPPLAWRIEAALDEVRPAIQRDGGDVWLVRIDGTTAFVQLVGACGGCHMSNATLKGAVEAAVRGRCPEILRVEQL